MLKIFGAIATMEKAPSRLQGRVLVACGFFVLLCSITTLERVSFKMLVDRVVPFRFLLVIFFVLFETLALMVIVNVRCLCGDRKESSGPFPARKLLLMAIIDLTKLFMMTLPASSVAPTLTVLLLQGHLPCTFLASICCQQLPYRGQHYLGAAMISFALLLALVPFFATWSDEAWSRDGWSTLIYLFSCIPASASKLCNERALMDYKQPMDPYALNLRISVYQLFLLFPGTLLAYRLQMLGSPPSSCVGKVCGQPGLLQSVRQGLRCLLMGQSPESHPAICDSAMPILLVYISSVLLVNFTVGRVLKYGSEKLLYRAVNASTLTAFVVLGALASGEPRPLLGLSMFLVRIISR